MSIWTKARLMWEIKNSPFSYHCQVRDSFRDEFEEKAGHKLSNYEIDLKLGDELILINAFYYKWDSENKRVMEIPGHLINKYGRGKHAFRADFATYTHATDMFAISHGLDVTFLPIEEAGDKPMITLVDTHCFQVIYEYLTEDTPPEHKRLLPELVAEVRDYQRYLSFEGYDTE